MGCRSDYLQPTGLEQGMKEAATLAVYLGSRAGLSVPADIAAQAKTLYANDVGQVQWLCKTLSEMDETLREQIVYDAHNVTSRALATWWEKHQQADIERIEDDAREAAFAKLTPADRRALGL